MPFTLTHTLAVTPFYSVRRYIPFPALLVGAMIPDLPLYLPLFSYNFFHSLYGLFLACLPAGIMLFLLFECIGKFLFVEIMPPWIRRRLVVYREQAFEFTYRSFFGVCLGVLIGAATHVFWDAFTHPGAWGVEYFSFLKRDYFVLGLVLPGYKVAQYGSSLIGLPLLALVVFFFLKMASVRDVAPVLSIRVVCSIWASLLFLPLFFFLTFYWIGHSLHGVLFFTAVRTIGVGSVLFLIYASIFYFVRRRSLY